MTHDELIEAAKLIASNLNKAKNMKTADDIGEVMSLIIRLHDRIKELEQENAGLKRGLEQRKSVLGTPIRETLKNIAELCLVEEGNPNYGFSFLDVEITDIVDQNAQPKSDIQAKNPEDQFDVPPKYFVAVGRYKYLKEARWQVGNMTTTMNLPDDDDA